MIFIVPTAIPYAFFKIYLYIYILGFDHCVFWIYPAPEMSGHAKTCPPWAEMSIIGMAGSSGSGKSSVALEIANSLNMPGAEILVMVRHFGPLMQRLRC